MQRNWIGRSEGLLVRFAIDPASTGALSGEAGLNELEIYTTRPDTLFGAKFMAVSPDHPLAAAAARHDPRLAAFIEECRRIGTSAAAIETAEKKGYETGLRVSHPFDAGWTLPVYVANLPQARAPLSRTCRNRRSGSMGAAACERAARRD